MEKRRCTVEGCEEEHQALGLCRKHHQRAYRAARVDACGHGDQFVQGRCWGCHLAHLRDTGQHARADRLVVLKRQRDEGRFDFKRLVDGMVEMYAEESVRYTTEGPPRETSPLRHGRPY